MTSCDRGAIAFDGYTQRLFGLPQEIPTRRLSFAMEDRRGRLWVAHRMGGLSYLDNAMSRKKVTGRDWTKVPMEVLPCKFGRTGVEWNTCASTILRIVEDDNGVLWLPTRSQGVYVFDEAGLRRVIPPPRTPAGLFQDLSTVFMGRDGRLWFGNARGKVGYLVTEQQGGVDGLGSD